MFPDGPANYSDEEYPVGYPRQKIRPRVPLKAYAAPLLAGSLAFVKKVQEKNENEHLSISELIAFLFDDADQLLEMERHSICVRFFGFSVIQHNMLLVEFYTGLPDAAQFCYVSSLLQRTVFNDYVKWDVGEKHGFLTHTLMALMKLRIGMSDEELAERFQVELHVVNMTFRLWVPALRKQVYKACENLYRYPVPYNVNSYTKILDIVEVCKETPEYTKAFRGHDKTRRAVLAVRSDGYVCFASRLFGQHVPDDACVQRSKFHRTSTYEDLVLARPELQHAVMSTGIACLRMTDEAVSVIESAVERIAEFKILTSVPEEYEDLAADVYKVCAALTNFLLPLPDV